MKPAVPALFGLCLLLAAADITNQLPAPYHTPSVQNGPKVIARPEGRALRLPPGFAAEPFATGLEKPRFLLELPGGVLVSESVPKGRVSWIAAGQPKKDVLTGLARPSALAFSQGYLYVAEDESVKRYKFDAKAMTAAAGEEVVSLKGYGKGHWTRGLAFDKAGKLYVSVGSSSNADAGDPPNRAAVNVYNADGSGHEIFSTGLRNPVGIHFHPKSGALWATVQERDGLGDDLVPDYFTEVKRGAFYGFPFAYLGPNEEPRRKGEAPEMVKKTMTPDVILPAHAAVMDFAFHTGRQFPAKYREGAFLAFRGSSNRSKRVGYSVVFVPFRNGRPAGEPEEFLTGWMLGAEEREVWGRPVGVLALRDGSLLVSEDANNTVWRITYKK